MNVNQEVAEIVTEHGIIDMPTIAQVAELVELFEGASQFIDSCPKQPVHVVESEATFGYW